MTKEIDLNTVPEGLPAPVDDGAAGHLVGLRLPALRLSATNGTSVTLSEIVPRTVFFCYPMTGRPGQPLPDGWDQIPGARGCTPQACSYRDKYNEFASSGVTVYGISTQTTEDQIEAAERLHLPYLLLSDERGELTRALKLPTFRAGAKTRIRRLTFVATNGLIEKVWYPVFPSDSDTPLVLAWLHR
ncbi:MAG: peroxiredoxin [Gemmatimonadaceae bacterium]|nr:peroxiredoxin [Gemmatimonadaceae bacterium]MBA3657633.1 peroxiredoxin [Gemmatimonadaceae bacterium]